ncbi:Signal transduction histidine kinase [Friedmanniella luteola]|uniref:histidine kinase n=1 Tax=Friedmanniella luteola TaxID=546871 RepID=A0A1H1YVX3_9ACTN|nr:HAMP domain-containing sensor histidine kinase [Friedmanniella luteola]SDT25685.1 Signal transduction histidine kinase [Friedmanniella luteola]
MSDQRPPWRGWSARLSLRARLIIIGLTGVGLALLAGGFAFYGALTFAVDRTLDDGALAAADEVATLVEADRLPSPVPVSGAQVVQVVDAQQRVVAGSATADRLTPLLRPDELARALAGEAVQVPGARAALAVPLRVRAVRAEAADGPVSVLVALPVGDVLAVRAALRTGLLVLFPLVLVALGVVAWRVVGSTLRPVEELRAQAEQISGTARAERLRVPAANDEVHALAVTLNQMLDRLAAGRARQRSFVADAAHELRSPLTSIRTQLEVAERLGEGGQLPAELLVDVDRLSRLVEDLLLLARADADSRSPARTVRVEADVLLAQVAARTPARVPVTVRPGPPVTVLADPEELRRAVQNLVDNAVRHAGSAVELSARAEAGQARLLVRDDGPGLPPEERERVFERFTRRDDARSRDVGGTGLGLPIARELAARAGGTVRLEDAPPPWALQAVVELPLVAASP